MTVKKTAGYGHVSATNAGGTYTKRSMDPNEGVQLTRQVLQACRHGSFVLLRGVFWRKPLSSFDCPDP